MEKEFEAKGTGRLRDAFDFDERDISLIEKIPVSKSELCGKEQTAYSEGRDKSLKRSVAMKKRFAEDEVSIGFGGKKRCGALNAFRGRAQSDDETESAKEEFVGRCANVLDDTMQLTGERSRVTYLNVLVAGESDLCTLEFVRYVFEEVFGQRLPPSNPQSKINDYSWASEARRQRRVVTLAHAQGFAEGEGSKKWWAEVKRYLCERMEAYDSLYKISLRARKPSTVDTRVHLLFFFLRAPTLRPSDAILLQKLQKYVCVVPVVLDRSPAPRVNFEYVKAVKAGMKRELDIYGVERLPFEEDVALSKILDRVLAGTLPFFVSAPNGLIDGKSLLSDLTPLIKLVTTPYITAHYYHTELIFSRHMQKQNLKLREEKRPDGKTAGETGDRGLGVGYGIAFGIGFISAIFAIKKSLN